MDSRIGIIGVGGLAGALVDGLGNPASEAPYIYLSPRNPLKAGELARRHPTVTVCADNQAVVDQSQVLIIAVRPEACDSVLAELVVPADRIVISVVSGLSDQQLRRHLGEQVVLVRAIPLPSVRQQRGVTVIYPGHPDVERLFDGLGGSIVLDDATTLAAIQTATATLSTHLHYVAEVAGWLTAQGVQAADAESYVRQLFIGVAGALTDSPAALAQLAQEHETPGGFNEQLRRTWFTDGNRAELIDRLDQVHRRLLDSATPPPA